MPFELAAARPGWMAVAGALLSLGVPRAAEAGPPASTVAVDFVRDVGPILRASCQKCHGPEKKMGKLRLDGREHAMKGGASGPVIVPGRSGESSLYKMLVHPDPDERMPRKADALPAEQVEIIRRWIDQGARWPDEAAGARLEQHWAYVKPVRPGVPSVAKARWARTPLDSFVMARLEREGLQPSPEAPRETLLRRLHLDLVGL